MIDNTNENNMFHKKRENSNSPQQGGVPPGDGAEMFMGFEEEPLAEESLGQGADVPENSFFEKESADSPSDEPSQDAYDVVEFTVGEDEDVDLAAEPNLDSSFSRSERQDGDNLPVRVTEDGVGVGHDEHGNQIARTSKGYVEESFAGDGDYSVRKKGRMGDRMVSMGIIDENQLNVALQEKKVSSKMLGEILVDLGFIDEDALMAFLSESSGFELFDPKATIVDGDALALLEKPVAIRLGALPVSLKGDMLAVAMADPYDVLSMDRLRKHLPKGVGIKPMVISASILNEAIDAAYGYASSISAILRELEENKDAVADLANLDEAQAFSHPIVRLVNALVFDAVKMGASDIHFEPEENFIRLRYRVDGVLHTAQTMHKQHWNGISQRIKILCEMNIADKLNAQDGRFGINVGGKEVDFRVSSLPTVHGENIVLRILDKSSSIMPLEKLGFSPHNLELIEKSQSKPEGIIIVTGPTGSGKTTSLYSMLNEINTVDVNIQTLEDPVEYSLPMIRQTHVREGILEFADGIKALLRQDPDIIFIGEIRDHTTAEMALKAAMTGHQVYTSLHTNDSFGAIPRLLDLGLKPGMIAGAIISVFAQRLTRRLCSGCREEYTPNEEECAILKVEPSEAPQIYRAKEGGCNLCGGSGYKGRVAVVEILTFDEEMDAILASGANKAELKEEALRKGFKNMKDDGILKVIEGVTDLNALSKVVDIRR